MVALALVDVVGFTLVVIFAGVLDPYPGGGGVDDFVLEPYPGGGRVDDFVLEPYPGGVGVVDLLLEPYPGGVGVVDLLLEPYPGGITVVDAFTVVVAVFTVGAVSYTHLTLPTKRIV